MSQFDVYINPSKKSRDAYPYIIDIQNALISNIITRIVIPLGKLSHFRNEQMDGLTPLIEYEKEQYILLTPQIASMPAKLLKDPVGSVEPLRDEIIAAIDLAITGI
ncbi:MAG: CcdB family protein [Colwellia polaris]|jgi:toxin CcdB|uniref:CcdB family protein n=1 Tax=Colwellia polaris TaxID=326537 RepID=UPI000A177529|nr:CcdB family protein [Colwellia polaris]|tara:strand:+ start:567 stop:884 length:318 start_codon:yes stop_codon:yes gene_type:complete